MKPLIVTLAGIIVFVSIGLLTHLTNGQPERLNQSAQFYNSYIKYEAQLPSQCVGSELYKQPRECYLGHDFQMDHPHIVYWGDSHAAHLIPHFSAQLDINKMSGAAAIKYGCAPLLDLQDYLPESFRAECTLFNNSVFESIRANDQVNRVVIAANWSALDGTLNTANKHEVFKRRVIERLTSMVNKLNHDDIRVTLYGPLPVNDFEPTMCLATSAFLGLNKSRCNSKPLRKDTFAFELNSHFRSLSIGNDLVEFIDLESALCDDQSCIVEIDNTPLYRDDDHLTKEASLKLSQILRDRSITN